mmetsp:Transcript_71571/g.207467  ORF Transcript_71571/g.207467 Transcript_71571/m.207467 type:complete len:205 (+) Transcript_71571:3-617(+)
MSPPSLPKGSHNARYSQSGASSCKCSTILFLAVFSSIVFLHWSQYKSAMSGTLLRPKSKPKTCPMVDVVKIRHFDCAGANQATNSYVCTARLWPFRKRERPLERWSAISLHTDGFSATMSTLGKLSHCWSNAFDCWRRASIRSTICRISGGTGQPAFSMTSAMPTAFQASSPDLVRKVTLRPFSPARPVRPMRWTWSSVLLAES